MSYLDHIDERTLNVQVGSFTFGVPSKSLQRQSYVPENLNTARNDVELRVVRFPAIMNLNFLPVWPM